MNSITLDISQKEVVELTTPTGKLNEPPNDRMIVESMLNTRTEVSLTSIEIISLHPGPIGTSLDQIGKFLPTASQREEIKEIEKKLFYRFRTK